MWIFNLTGDTYHLYIFPSLALEKLPESVILQDFLKLQSSINKLTFQDGVGLQFNPKCTYMALIVLFCKCLLNLLTVHLYKCLVLFNVYYCLHLYRCIER